MLVPSGVKHRIVAEGNNDLGIPPLIGNLAEEVTAEQVIQGHRQIIDRAHAMGLRVDRIESRRGVPTVGTGDLVTRTGGAGTALGQDLAGSRAAPGGDSTSGTPSAGSVYRDRVAVRAGQLP